MLNVIQTATVTGPQNVRIVYSDGEVRDVDFHGIIDKGGVFSPLANFEFFAQV